MLSSHSISKATILVSDPIMASEKQGRKIVVAVDEGEESNHALSWCLKNVAAAGDTLILLYVQPPRIVYSAMDGSGSLSRFSHLISAVGYFCYSALKSLILRLSLLPGRRRDHGEVQRGGGGGGGTESRANLR